MDLISRHSLADLGYWEFHIQSDKFICTKEVFNILGLRPPAENISETEIHLDTIIGLIHPEDKNIFLKAFDTARTGVIPLNLEHRIIKAGGEVCYLYQRAEDISDEGKIIKLTGSMLDITIRKTMENALKESQSILSGIINSAMDAVITLDVHQNVILFNLAAEKMFKCKAADAIGKPVDKFIPGRYREIHKKHIENFGRTGISMRSMGAINPLSGLRADGEEFPIEASISQVDVKGKKLFTVIIRDITEKRLAEEALISSEARYRLLFKKNPLPMWVFDTETLKFLTVNFAAVKSYGYTRDEFLSMTIKDIRPSEDVPLLENYISHFRSSLQEAGIWRHRKKDGTLIDVEIISHETDFDGKPARLVLALDVTEKIKAETALKESEAFQKSLIESSPLPIYSIDVNGNVLTWNEAAEKVFGWTFDEVVGKPNPIVPEESWSEFTGHLKHVLAGNSISGKELLRKKKDGSPIDISLSIAPIYDANNDIIGVIATIEDITERKRNEKQIKFQAHLLSEIGEAVIATDLNNKIIYWNKAAEKLYGWFAEEVLVRDILDIIPSKINRKQAAEIMERLVKGENWEGQLLVKRKDGTTFHARVNNSPILNDKNELIGVVGISSDITEQIEAEEELRKLSFAVEQSPASIIITGIDGRIEYVNPKFCQVTGYSPDEVIGKKPSILKSGETSETDYKTLWETIKAGGEWSGEFHNRKKSGELFWEFASISPIKNENGEITHFIAVKEDITEGKRVEEELKFSQKQLRALAAHLQNIREQERTAIAREIHDELGQVLTSLKMNLTFIDKNISEKRNKIDVAELKNEISSMTSVIDNSVKRVKKIITELRPETLDSLGLIPALEWLCKEFETNSKIKCNLSNKCGEIDLNKDVSIAVFRIFQEALTNITRHSKATKVNVRIALTANILNLEVEDDGVGFDTLMLRKNQSFGVLGMKERAIILGGQFKIETLKPNGTKITVNIPLKSSF